jgi:hypothetical protein
VVTRTAVAEVPQRTLEKEAPADRSGAFFAADGLSAWSGALRAGTYSVERLARGHGQAIALGAAEADVGAHLGQADAADQRAFRRPYRHAVIADVARFGSVTKRI